MGTLISKIVFQPPNDNGYEGFQKINTADGAHVCFLRTTPPKVYLEPRKSSVVYFHGTGENLRLLRSLLQSVAKITGKEVFAMDYRGYNQKKATRTLPNEIQFKSDVEAFVDGLQLKGDDVIVWGRSLGSSAAIRAAAFLQRKNGGISTLILQSGFYSAGTTKFPCLPRAVDIFKNYIDMEDIDPERVGTVLIVHGEDDAVVPVSHATKMFKRFKDRGFNVHIKYFPYRNHNNIPASDVWDFYESVKSTSSE